MSDWDAGPFVLALISAIAIFVAGVVAGSYMGENTVARAVCAASDYEDGRFDQGTETIKCWSESGWRGEQSTDR